MFIFLFYIAVVQIREFKPFFEAIRRGVIQGVFYTPHDHNNDLDKSQYAGTDHKSEDVNLVRFRGRVCRAVTSHNVTSCSDDERNVVCECVPIKVRTGMISVKYLIIYIIFTFQKQARAVDDSLLVFLCKMIIKVRATLQLL